MEVRDSFKLIQAFHHADIYIVEHQPILVIEATNAYLPIDEFKKIFTKAEEVIREQSIQKVIFD